MFLFYGNNIKTNYGKLAYDFKFNYIDKKELNLKKLITVLEKTINK
jgi:hypothetical protein